PTEAEVTFGPLSLADTHRVEVRTPPAEEPHISIDPASVPQAVTVADGDEVRAVAVFGQEEPEGFYATVGAIDTHTGGVDWHNAPEDAFQFDVEWRDPNLGSDVVFAVQDKPYLFVSFDEVVEREWRVIAWTSEGPFYTDWVPWTPPESLVPDEEQLVASRW